jgi:hypothetical protein
MSKGCECGTECPTCGGQPNRAVDFYDYIPVLEAVFERIKLSIKKHGAWQNYSEEQVFDAISGEFVEYWGAHALRNRDGEHGQVDELYDVMVTSAKGILRLTEMDPAGGAVELAGLVLPAEMDEGASDDVLVLTDDLCFAVGFYDFTAKTWMTRWGFELPKVLRWMPLPKV